MTEGFEQEYTSRYGRLDEVLQGQRFSAPYRYADDGTLLLLTRIFIECGVEKSPNLFVNWLKGQNGDRVISFVGADISEREATQLGGRFLVFDLSGNVVESVAQGGRVTQSQLQQARKVEFDFFMQQISSLICDVDGKPALARDVLNFFDSTPKLKEPKPLEILIAPKKDRVDSVWIPRRSLTQLVA